jgi:lipopolysaccharide export system protein LptA
MTEGKRRVRLLAALLAGGWLVVLVALYRKPGTQPSESHDEIAGTLVAEAGSVHDKMRFRDFEYVETRGGEGRFRILAAEALRFDVEWERKFRLKDVMFESGPASASVGVRLYAPRAEFTEQSRAFRVFDGVEIAGEEARLSGEAFRYEPTKRELVSEGPVTAQRGRLVIRADGAVVSTQDGRVFLTGNVRLRGRSEKGEALDVESPRVELSRGGTILATGDETVARSTGIVIRARSLERSRDGDGDRLRAEGSAILVLAPVVARLPGAALVHGDAIDLVRDRSSEPAFLAVTSTPPSLSEIELAPGARENGRTGLSVRLEARFQKGVLSEIGAPSSLTAREAAGPDVRPGGGLRTLTAGSARLTFEKEGRLDVGLFEGGVSVTEGTRASLKGAVATLRGADDAAVVTGAPAEYRDPEATLVARTIVYGRRDDRIDASGQVRASFSGEGRPGLFGERDGGPLFSESDTFRLTEGRKHLQLAGNVRAWQKENVLRCETLFVDNADRSVRAEKNVRVFFRRDASVRTSGRTGVSAGSETINASGDVLTHRESEHFVRIEGHAEVISGAWQITADVTDLRLGADRSIEYAEARGSVILEDRSQHRHGEGTKATWRPQTEIVTLEGRPATAVDGKGNRSTGAFLTFRQGRSQVDVETGTVPSETTFKPEGS